MLATFVRRKSSALTRLPASLCHAVKIDEEWRNSDCGVTADSKRYLLLTPGYKNAGDSKPHSLVADELSPRPQTLPSQILHGHSARLTTRSSYSTVSEPSREDEENTAADPLWNWPNGISMARLVSGPVIAYLILDGHWSLALGSLAVSGASDWLDGFVARRFNQKSVIGSYLDPLADKFLICSVTGALAYEGSLYAPLAWLIIGRDVSLVVGAFVLRFRAVNWQWPGWKEFFRTTSPQQGKEKATLQQTVHVEVANDSTKSGQNTAAGAAPFVTPLYISKVNTVFQLSLIGASITSSWYRWPSDDALIALGSLTAILTCASGYEYYRTRRKK